MSSRRKRTSRHHSTIQGCLNAIGVDAALLLAACADPNHDGDELLDEQFRLVKQAYRAKALETHPDKGGNPEEFREIQTSFEVLRELYSTKKVSSFVSDKNGSSSGGAGAAEAAAAAAADYGDAYDATWQNFSEMPTPSWDFFYEATPEKVPSYRVEQAKSGRSQCKKHGNKNLGRCNDQPNAFIPQGEIRVGSMDSMSGSYARWVHLRCWRVLNRVWKGLPNYNKNAEEEDEEQCLPPDAKQFEIALLAMNDFLFCGLQELSKEDRARVVEHVMNKENYARDTKPRRKKLLAAAEAETETTEMVTNNIDNDGSLKPAASQVVKAKEVFVIPRPGQNGVLANLLDKLTVVLTGVFPEVGGGMGLTLGNAKVKRMVESFGGRVTTCVSGKTTFLVTGKEPGACMVGDAQVRGLPILSLLDLKNGLEDNCIHAIVQERKERPPVISNFSLGYNNSSVGRIHETAAPAAAAAAAAAAAPPIKKKTGTAAEKQAPKPQLDASAPAFVPSAAADGAAAAPPKALQLDAAAKDFVPSPSLATTATAWSSSKPARAKQEDEEEPALDKKMSAVANKPAPVKNGAVKSDKEESSTKDQQQATKKKSAAGAQLASKKKSAAVASTKRKPKSSESNNDKKSSPTESYSEQEQHKAPPPKKPRQQSKTTTATTTENKKPTTTTTTSKAGNTHKQRKNAAKDPKPRAVGTRSSKRLKALTHE